jgi:hypothetical protein
LAASRRFQSRTASSLARKQSRWNRGPGMIHPLNGRLRRPCRFASQTAGTLAPRTHLLTANPLRTTRHRWFQSVDLPCVPSSWSSRRVGRAAGGLSGHVVLAFDRRGPNVTKGPLRWGAAERSLWLTHTETRWRNHARISGRPSSSSVARTLMKRKETQRSSRSEARTANRPSLSGGRTPATRHWSSPVRTRTFDTLARRRVHSPGLLLLLPKSDESDGLGYSRRD